VGDSGLVGSEIAEEVVVVGGVEARLGFDWARWMSARPVFLVFSLEVSIEIGGRERTFLSDCFFLLPMQLV
jgi:hypothetical protein